MAKTFGPAKLSKARLAPYQGVVPPAVPGGATAPMPIPVSIARAPSKQKIQIRQEPIPSDPEPPMPVFVPPERKRKAPRQAEPINRKQFRQPRGVGHHIGPPPDPFRGVGQRLPDEDVAKNARERMVDLARRAQQTSRKGQDFEKLRENAKALRRGGAPGDVVGQGKRKAIEPDAPLSILRKPATHEAPRSKPRLYGKKTIVHDMTAEPIRVY